MEIYTLTSNGHKLARSTNNPDTPAWRVIHYLDRTGHSTIEQIVDYCGVSRGEAAAIMRMLRRKSVVAEASGVEV